MNLTRGAFCMGTRVTYPLQVKPESIEMKLVGKTVKEINEMLFDLVPLRWVSSIIIKVYFLT